MVLRPRSTSDHMTTDRIGTLIDSVFAIVITLLVFTLEIPEVPGPVSDAALRRALGNMLPQFALYGVTFLLLAMLWYNNHRYFRVVERADTGLHLLTLLWLMLVAVLPFSTSLNGRYGGLHVPAAVFHTNMLLIGSVLFLTWVHANRMGLVSDRLDQTSRSLLGSLSLVFPAAALVGLLLSFFTPLWSPIVYLAIPVVRWALDTRPRRPATEDG
jgi:uncharacterized membrane protein